MVIFVVGPTASGKSALGHALAEHFGGAILNCDSLQACQRLNVGSAKPNAAERASVPHLLFDLVPPGGSFTAGDFRRAALAALAEATKAGPVFAVGGSGFYVQALERGMFDVPDRGSVGPVEAALRERLSREGSAPLFAELDRADPEYARRIGSADAYRILRALVMIAETGRTVTELRRDFTPTPLPYPTLKLGLDPAREALARRVSLRTARMLADGLIEETKALIDEGFGDWPALSSVGYRETKAYLGGELSHDELAPLITLKTMQLAKRQRTWFRRDPSIHWLDPADAFAPARALVRAFLDASPAPIVGP